MLFEQQLFAIGTQDVNLSIYLYSPPQINATCFGYLVSLIIAT